MLPLATITRRIHMARLTPETKNYIERHKGVSNRQLAVEIKQVFDLAISHTAVGNYKKKIGGKKAESLEAKPPSPAPTAEPRRKNSTIKIKQIDVDAILTFENLDAIVTSRRNAAAEALYVKFNTGGQVNYARRNKNKYLLVAKAVLDIARELFKAELADQ